CSWGNQTPVTLGRACMETHGNTPSVTMETHGNTRLLPWRPMVTPAFPFVIGPGEIPCPFT
ncbi:hypothetical protein NHX12_030140, partial [Muraenolepis orangiensis]